MVVSVLTLALIIQGAHSISFRTQPWTHFFHTDQILSDDSLSEPLLVNCDINGFSVPAVIDTGAQLSVMSESCLKRCHMQHALDTRYSGKVVGVGQSEIIGRVPSIPIQLGPLAFKSKVSVLKDARVDLIIGMDLLNKFETEINVKQKWVKLRAHKKSYKIPVISKPVISNNLRNVVRTGHTSLFDRYRSSNVVDPSPMVTQLIPDIASSFVSNANIMPIRRSHPSVSLSEDQYEDEESVSLEGV